jgi:hypothetical protein
MGFGAAEQEEAQQLGILSDSCLQTEPQLRAPPAQLSSSLGLA